jgi:hypothetical protein
MANGLIVIALSTVFAICTGGLVLYFLPNTLF